MAEPKNVFIKAIEEIRAKEVQKASKPPSIFSRASDWIWTLVEAHWKLLSALLLAAALAWQVFSGMYDVSAVTTTELQGDLRSWQGREVSLTNVTVEKFELWEEGTNTLFRLWLANGRTNPPVEQKPLAVIGKMLTSDAREIESLPWLLTRSNPLRLAQARVRVSVDYVALTQSAQFTDVSLFSTPYWFTVNMVNRFASLKVSVYVGLSVQLLIYAFVALLGVAGLVYVIPSVD